MCDNTQHGRDQCDRHADDAIPVTSPGGFLVGKSAKGKDEEDSRNDIRHSNNSFDIHNGLTF